MPQALQDLFNLESTRTPDLLPAYNITARTWNDTTQAVRRRLNIRGDKDGSPVLAHTVNITSGYTGNILVAQFVGVDSYRRRRQGRVDSGSSYIRGWCAGLVSVATVNAKLTAGMCAIQPGLNSITTSPISNTDATAYTTALTAKFFLNNNWNDSMILSDAGNFVVEVGINVTASTSAGTCTLYFGSAGTVDINENLASNVTTAANPLFYIQGDVSRYEHNSPAALFRAEDSLSANIGF